jgi:hypothetical protein
LSLSTRIFLAHAQSGTGPAEIADPAKRKIGASRAFIALKAINLFPALRLRQDASAERCASR